MPPNCIKAVFGVIAEGKLLMREANVLARVPIRLTLVNIGERMLYQFMLNYLTGDDDGIVSIWNYPLRDAYNHNVSILSSLERINVFVELLS